MGTGEPSGIEALTMLGIYEARYEDLETRLGLASSSPGVVMVWLYLVLQPKRKVHIMDLFAKHKQKL